MISGGALKLGGEVHVEKTLRISGGAKTLDTVTGMGEGVVELSSGTLSVSGSATLENFTQTGGTRSGVGHLTVTGASTLSGGVMIGPGRTITEGELVISGSIGVDEGHVLEVHDGAQWTAGVINLNPNSTGTNAGHDPDSHPGSHALRKAERDRKCDRCRDPRNRTRKRLRPAARVELDLPDL